jgi:hypothetical protein
MVRRWTLAGVVGGLIAILLFTSTASQLGIVSVELQRPDTHLMWSYSSWPGSSPGRRQ